jgi:hypothetical protein
LKIVLSILKWLIIHRRNIGTQYLLALSHASYNGWVIAWFWPRLQQKLWFDDVHTSWTHLHLINWWLRFQMGTNLTQI